MAFHLNAVFPSKIAANSTVGWGFDGVVLSSTGGAEQRILRTETVRHVADISTGISDPAELFAVKRFHLGRRGHIYGFNFQDPLDHRSNFDPLGTVLATDQTIGIGDGTTTDFQLIKTYDDPDLVYVRHITKPKSGTVLIALNGSVQGSGWSVNLATGVVTFTSAPGNGVEITAGYHFYTPMRFDEDAGRNLEIAFREFKYGDIPRIGLVEIPEEGFGDDNAWGGGHNNQPSMAADITIVPIQGRLVTLAPQISGLSCRLPSTTLPGLAPGGPIFYVQNNTGLGHSVALRDSSGTLVVSIAAGDIYAVLLGENSIGGRFWVPFKG